MALGDSSPFAPVDLLGGLVANVLATNAACKNYDFRVGIGITAKDAQGNVKKEVPAYLDFRFLGGLAAAVGGQLTGNPMARRVGHDVASGLLNSFVATETCRNHALKRVSQAEWASEDGPHRMLDDQAAPQAAPAGAPNYAYGW